VGDGEVEGIERSKRGSQLTKQRTFERYGKERKAGKGPTQEMEKVWRMLAADVQE
jgi:hypothetical protein